MPFSCNGGETMEDTDTIEFIGTLLVTAIKIALYVMAGIALAKYIMS